MGSAMAAAAGAAGGDIDCEQAASVPIMKKPSQGLRICI
jgi:hypothetical protein